MFTSSIPYPPSITNLSGPDPLNSLGNTNIVRLKLVKSHTHHHRRKLQRPVGGLPRLWYALAGNVIDDHGLETDM